jgi:hypothetical protein
VIDARASAEIGDEKGCGQMGGKKKFNTDNNVFTDDVALSEGHPEPQG